MMNDAGTATIEIDALREVVASDQDDRRVRLCGWCPKSIGPLPLYLIVGAVDRLFTKQALQGLTEYLLCLLKYAENQDVARSHPA